MRCANDDIVLRLMRVLGYSGLQAERLVEFYGRNGRLEDLIALIEANKEAPDDW